MRDSNKRMRDDNKRITHSYKVKNFEISIFINDI